MSTDTYQDESRVQDCPATIIIKGGHAFIVRDIGAWVINDYGVFAIGQWNDHDEEQNLLIPWHQITLIIYDFEGLYEHTANELIEAATGPEQLSLLDEEDPDA